MNTNDVANKFEKCLELIIYTSVYKLEIIGYVKYFRVSIINDPVACFERDMFYGNWPKAWYLPYFLSHSK